MNFVFYLHDEPSAKDFEQKLLWFKNRYNLVSYQDVLDCIYNGKKLTNACHLTVDDGWLSTYDVIFPAIKAHNIPLTIFVSPKICRDSTNFWYKDIAELPEESFKQYLIDRNLFKPAILKYPLDLIMKELDVDTIYKVIGDFRKDYNYPNPKRQFINTSELLEIAGSELVEIGAHTLTHPILANENLKKSTDEIKESIEQLSTMLNKQITAFAYPNGLTDVDFSSREQAIVNECGIKAAFTVNPGCITHTTNPLTIPRLGSKKRLLLGKSGILLPSLSRQQSVRQEIRKLKK